MRTLDELGISPAPWKVDDRYGYVNGIISANGDCVVETDSGIYPPEMPDARLIAAAPSLYEALRGLLEIVCDDCKSWYGESREKCKGCPRVRVARAALAAASGESEPDARVWCKHDPTRYCVDCEGCPDESEVNHE